MDNGDLNRKLRKIIDQAAERSMDEDVKKSKRGLLIALIIVLIIITVAVLVGVYATDEQLKVLDGMWPKG